MSRLQARDVYEAVALAENLKRNGKYQWFRGQTRSWPLKSSFARLSEDAQEEALKKAARFEGWMKHTPGLEEVASNADAAIAVAQHYGLPTNFIDFTIEPRVAGFFATDAGYAGGDVEGCILCLDTADLGEFWRALPERYPPPEFLRLQVPNLWRLEAQFGVFLFCPYDGFEKMYDLDRICFPQVPQASIMSASSVYPDRKSQLEILLDQYFMNEMLLEGMRYSERELSAWTIVTMSPPPPSLCDLDLLNRELPLLTSWDQDRLEAWLTPRRERYFETQTQELRVLKTMLNWSPAELVASVTSQVLSQLSERHVLRTQLATWGLDSPGNPIPKEVAENVSNLLSRQWDGMRMLPYSDSEIAMSMAVSLALVVCVGSLEEKLHGLLGRQLVEIEFGSKDGAYSRALVSDQDLQTAMRQDMQGFLRQPELSVHATVMLQACQAPNRLFEFERLAHIFASQVIPTQIQMRDTPSAIYYSPARLDTLGLP